MTVHQGRGIATMGAKSIRIEFGKPFVDQPVAPEWRDWELPYNPDTHYERIARSLVREVSQVGITRVTIWLEEQKLASWSREQEFADSYCA
jgi:hypothetical protein